MKKRHKISLALLTTAALLGAGAALLPWKSLAEQKLESALTAYGLQNVDLHIAALSPRSVTLSNITAGAENPVTLKDITIDYSLRDLLERRLETLSLSGLTLTLRKSPLGWSLDGLERDAKKDAPPFAVPVSRESLRALLPFNRAKLEDSTLTITDPGWNAALPLALEYTGADKNEFSYSAGGLTFTKDKIAATTGAVTLKGALDESASAWKGTWNAEDIAITGLAVPVPPLAGGGTFLIEASRITFSGKLASEGNTHHAEFTYIQDLHDAQGAKLNIASAALPWMDGRIALKDAALAPFSAAPINITLHVTHVSVDELLRSFTGERVSATGTVSGALPLTLHRNGEFSFKTGGLRAEGPGTITMPPDAIPGDQAQIALVRDIMANLQYDALSITLGENGDQSILLKLEGRNPSVYEGKPVKLNVRLTGDVIDFVRQNLTLLTNPEKLLENTQQE